MTKASRLYAQIVAGRSGCQVRQLLDLIREHRLEVEE